MNPDIDLPETYGEQIEDAISANFRQTSLTPTDIELHKEVFIGRVVETLKQTVGDDALLLTDDISRYLDAELERRMRED